MRVVISGSSGLIGTALVERLHSSGHHVVRLVRARPSGGDVAWDPAAGTLDPAALDGADAVVHLAGAGIGDHRWTAEHRRQIHDSRLRSTELLARTMAAVERPPPVWLSGSAIGIYGARDDEQLSETSTIGTGFLADVCRAWEGATAEAEAAGIRVAHLRTGIVLTTRGGALAKQLPLFRLGLGGRFGSGQAWQSWISLDDEVRAIEHLLTSELHGPVNLTAPNPVRNAELARTLGRVLRRPSVIPVPAFGPRLLLGRDLADSLLFTSQRVLPVALSSDGFEFAHPTIEVALRAVLDRPARCGNLGS